MTGQLETRKLEKSRKLDFYQAIKVEFHRTGRKKNGFKEFFQSRIFMYFHHDTYRQKYNLSSGLSKDWSLWRRMIPFLVFSRPE